MVALVTHGADDAPIAVHRTFVGRDGASKAPVDPQKMMLGFWTSKKGASVLAWGQRHKTFPNPEQLLTGFWKIIAESCKMPALI
jgi:hypothetical protein